ncbi:Transcription factor gsfR2 [Paramyrothecium foliicola]|nr:Transcription factor gsfR2 [Paramyrothecium foliicola]
MRNEENAGLIRSEVARRTARLISAMQMASTSNPTVEIDLLPPVQALLIYQCMRLFSDNVSERLQAERDELWLRSWTARLRMYLRSLDGAAECWVSWVRAETIRRTVVTAETIVGLGTFLKQEWENVEARLRTLEFTAQAALWDAKSAVEWKAAWARRPRLEVRLVDLARAMQESLQDDVDDLSIIVHATHLGLDALEEWLGGDRSALVKWGLRPSRNDSAQQHRSH